LTPFIEDTVETLHNGYLGDNREMGRVLKAVAFVEMWLLKKVKIRVNERANERTKKKQPSQRGGSL